LSSCCCCPHRLCTSTTHAAAAVVGPGIACCVACLQRCWCCCLSGSGVRRGRGVCAGVRWRCAENAGGWCCGWCLQAEDMLLMPVARAATSAVGRRTSSGGHTLTCHASHEGGSGERARRDACPHGPQLMHRSPAHAADPTDVHAQVHGVAAQL
jgi:hypothetical protein